MLKKNRTKTTICFCCLASCDLSHSVSVKTTSDYFHGELVLWIFRCATVLGDVVHVFIPLTSLAVMSVLVIGFRYCKSRIQIEMIFIDKQTFSLSFKG